MGVRLNKVLSELNIGLQTAVDFLKKKSELGEVKEDVTPNTKISDGQYEALVDAFSTDKAVKSQADKLFVKKPKEKKIEKPEMAVTKSDELLEQKRMQLKTLGKINLDEIGKPKPSPAPAPEPVIQPEVTAETPKPTEPEPVVQAEQQEVEQEPVDNIPSDTAEEIVEETAVETTVEETVDEETSVEEKVEKKVEVPDRPSLAKTPGDLKAAKNAPQLNVVGKIDLSSINQSTRPKKKTKEERRKEREEKAAGERKKRERIRTDRVDIEAAAKQANQQSKKNKNNGQQGADNRQQQGGKKNKKNRPVKPLEVDDEAVARQVKETLARLTSKSNQNKKGAKYRKEKRDAMYERGDGRRGSTEQGAQADRVRHRLGIGNDDERRCQSGYRYLHVHWYHGIYQPALGCGDHQYRCRRVRLHH